MGVMDYVGQLRDAASAFGDRLGDTHLLPLAIALGLHLLSLLVRSGVWCGILRAAFPEQRVGLRATTWAYLAGVGANAIAPFRGGDIVRIFVVRRQIPGSSVATIVSTLVAETVFGSVVIAALVAATVGLGWLPPIVHLPDARAFEFSFYARHVGLVAVALGLIAAAAVLWAEWAAHHLRGLWLHFVQGLRVLRSPGRFARVVAAPQLVDWVLRIGVAYAMLAAFGIPTAVRYAVLVVVIDSVSTALPVTPGGVGAQQGLLVFAFAGVAGAGRVTAFSIGAQAVIVAFNIVLGLVAIFVLFGHIRMGSVRRDAHALRAPAPNRMP
jgi:glycosyltransferase 2 family protein